MHHPVEHWLEREIAKWVHPMKDRSDDPSHHERTVLPRSYISLLTTLNYIYVTFGIKQKTAEIMKLVFGGCFFFFFFFLNTNCFYIIIAAIIITISIVINIIVLLEFYLFIGLEN